ncbi:hypothetical protein QE449_001440 [Rhodococcus sp. SORGH_AS303]|nr:hypothetical protein [Rhodococcus sp. SORGH_AS_0303]
MRLGVRAGLRRGRLDRSIIAGAPPARYRSAHFLAVLGETWKRSAARRMDQWSSTIELASFNRPLGVREALAWDTRTSRLSVQLW